MAGFGIVSLTQTAVGSLIDQRAVVLYEQPKDEPVREDSLLSDVENELFGSAFKYKELFSGLLDDLGVVSSVANITGTNPYGITYIEAKVNIESELCDHPVEKGTIITDASILLPVSAEVIVAMPTFFAERIYQQMKDLLEKKEKMTILQTKFGVYRNLVLQNMEYELEHETIDRAKFILSFREIQEVDSYGDFKNVANSNQIENPSDATTINTGTQTAQLGGVY